MALVAVIALVAILGVCLVACNAESIQKKLEKAGYACTSYEAGKDDDGASIEWKVVAKKKGLNADYVTVTKFANTDDAENMKECGYRFCRRIHRCCQESRQSLLLRLRARR